MTQEPCSLRSLVISIATINSLQFHIIYGQLFCFSIYTQRIKFQNLVESNKIWIVITIFRHIKHQSEYWLVQNLSEKGNYSPNWYGSTIFQKDFSLRNKYECSWKIQLQSPMTFKTIWPLKHIWNEICMNGATPKMST